MPVTRVSRTIAAPPEAVWRVLADAHHQPQWWPRVRRVEGVEDGRFTQVLMTERGKGIRADFVVLEAEPPRRLRWSQELAGSPFERLLSEAVTTFELSAAGDGATAVAVELRQQLCGWSRLTPFLFKRAARRQLGEALEALDAAVAPAGG
jgi:uncharacterized protein YndB with AHSA1/START domain